MGRVLIVDDEADVRTLIRTNLLVKGYEVSEADDGEKALAEIEANQPDLVILDVMMPGIDGFEVLEKLRSTPETESVPVIMLTAKTSEEDRVKGLVNGANDYVAKPFYTTELLLRIDRVLNTKATADSLRQVSITDAVTGINNRRYFELRIEQICDKAKLDGNDLVGFVADMQGMHDAARRKGWSTVDKVLAAAGARIKDLLTPSEEAFWLGTEFVILDSEIKGASGARSRLEKIRRELTETLGNHRREIQLQPYFGFAFFRTGESASEFAEHVRQSPYRATSTTAPSEETAADPDKGAEKAFGGKLTGLAPVAPSPVEEAAAREARSKKGKRVLNAELAREMREISSLAAAAKSMDRGDTEHASGEADKAVGSGPVPPAVPVLGDARALLDFTTSECTSAAAEPHDLAIYTIDLQGIDESVAMAGKEAVDKALGPVTLDVAAMAREGETPFWNGRQLLFVAPGVSVKAARRRVDKFREAYVDGLLPHRTKVRITPVGGYAFFGFDETPQEFIARAIASPHRGAPPITPLQARERSASMERSVEAPTSGPVSGTSGPVADPIQEVGGGEVSGDGDRPSSGQASDRDGIPLTVKIDPEATSQLQDPS